MNQTIDYNSPAEKFFSEKGLSMLLFRQGFINETGRHIEGDFRLDDGRTVEVKTDSRCFSSTNPTGNIPIEIDHPRHEGRKGWYHHCIMEGVSIVLFVCCEDEECKRAVMYVSIPMDGLKEFVTVKMQDAAYMKNHFRRTWDGVGNLCVPYQKILTIPGTRQITPIEVHGDGKQIWTAPTYSRQEDSTHEQTNL